MSLWHRPFRFLRDGVSVLAAAGLVFVTRSSFADHYHVPSGSMEPTIHTGDHILVSKMAYGLRMPLTHVQMVNFHAPARGDVVVLDSPENGTVLLKRVVAIGGDRVAVHDGEVSINGAPQPTHNKDDGELEEWLDGRVHALGSLGGSELPETVVPPGEILVMGDNRGNSHDGRDFGFVSASTVLGRAVAVFARRGVLGWHGL
ncbi:signal peptidase I [Pendulispora rubella]|uniref:Signal peptidase I n=1 Tax=Pendulispora rubella TaxID=2741070 RepID=A0ABZ2LC16_9BACT